MRFGWLAFLMLGLWFVATRAVAQQRYLPRHLTDAQRLVQQLNIKNTNYEHGPGRVVWEGVCESHTDCSGFIDALLMHSYGYNQDAFKRWFDSHRPTARRYHDAIVQGRGFSEIKSVAETLPGDILAIKYLVEKSNTGHMMLVVEPPHWIEPLEPLVPGTQQWQVTVIDSSNSGHGPTDTRHHLGVNGKDHDGLGQGVFRIYTDRRGELVGFAWSTLKASKFQTPEEEHLVIGRLKTNFIP
jgi:hypothetical protein